MIRAALDVSVRPSAAESVPCRCGACRIADTTPDGVPYLRCNGCGAKEIIPRRAAGDVVRDSIFVRKSPPKCSASALLAAARNRARAVRYPWVNIDGRSFLGSVRELANGHPDERLDTASLHKVSKMVTGRAVHRGWSVDRRVTA